MISKNVKFGLLFCLLPMSGIATELNLPPCETATKSAKRIACATVKQGQERTGSALNDINKLKAISLVKGELETSAEHSARVKKLYSDYNNRVYKVSLSVKDQNSRREKLVSYDPDTETLNVTLPRLNFTTVGLGDGKETETYRITSSFMALNSSGVKSSKYTARNGYGRETTVAKLEAASSGLALLGSSNNNMEGQHFSTTISRDRVKDILDRGQVVLTVRTELLQDGPDTFLMDKWLSPKGASLLVIDQDEREPTMKDPIHVIKHTHSLPVRLLSIEVLDGNRKEVLQGSGTEIDTTSLVKQ